MSKRTTKEGYSRPPAGFTLTETIIVLIIITIIAAVVTTRWPTGSAEIDATAKQVTSDLRYTQSLSMSLNDPYEFHYGGTSYYISHYISGTETKIGHPSSPGTTDIVLGQSISFTSSGCVAFSGRGAPVACEGSSTVPTSITLQKSGATNKTITITSETGYISLS